MNFGSRAAERGFIRPAEPPGRARPRTGRIHQLAHPLEWVRHDTNTIFDLVQARIHADNPHSTPAAAACSPGIDTTYP